MECDQQIEMYTYSINIDSTDESSSSTPYCYIVLHATAVKLISGHVPFALGFKLGMQLTALDTAYLTAYAFPLTNGR